MLGLAMGTGNALAQKTGREFKLGAAAAGNKDELIQVPEGIGGQAHLLQRCFGLGLGLTFGTGCIVLQCGKWYHADRAMGDFTECTVVIFEGGAAGHGA